MWFSSWLGSPQLTTSHVGPLCLLWNEASDILHNALYFQQEQDHDKIPYPTTYRLPNLDVVPLDLQKGNICSGLLQDISVMDSTLYTAHITSNTETLQME